LLYLNFHCQSNTPVAHHFDNQLGLQSKHSARAIETYQQKEVETAAVKWLTTVTAGLPRTKPAVH
jgi:hypothetical protein